MKQFAYLVCLFGLSCSVLLAVKTRSVEQHDFAAFIAGEPENVSISNLGEMELAPALEEIATLDDPIIWDAVADSQGNVYLGTGKEGTVYKMTPAGEVETVFKPEETLTRTLAIDTEDNLYVGSSPNGRVYRIAPGQRPEIYFDPEDEYIWDLVFDKEGNLYVATGAEGTIFKLKPDFKPGDEAETWFTSDRVHVTTMTFDDEGNLLAGTAPRAYVYRISPDGTGTVIYNAGTDEISALHAGENGTVYFSTLHANGHGNKDKNATTAMDLPTVLEKLYRGSTTKTTTTNNNDDKEEEPLAAQAPSLLFRIGPDGFTEPIWSPVSMNIYTFRAAGDGEFYIGGSENGQLFKVRDLTSWRLLQSAKTGGEISRMIPVPNEEGALYIMTSNPGAVYKLSSKPSEEGNFTGEPVDASVSADWGALRLFGSIPQDIAGLSWETRTGNSPEPDETWSDWQPLRDHSVASPHGRYLQYRANFDKTEAILRGVRLFYTYRNGAPIVSRINLLPVGLTVVTIPPKDSPVNVSQLTSGKNGKSIQVQRPPVRQIRPLSEPGFFSAGWRSFDPNGDKLIYSVAVKAESDEDWVTLGEDLEVNVFSFNTRGLDDGYYMLKVTASDERSNPPGEARTGMKLSQPFLVDNSNPSVTLETQKRNENSYVLVFTASDKYSIIAEANYVLDGGKPVQLQPEDGIFDSQEEIFRVVLEDPKAGSHSIVVEVEDESGNRGVAQAVFTIEAAQADTPAETP